MIRKISLILLAVTLFTFAFSLTSCESTGQGIVNSITSILPAEDSSSIAKAAHDLTDWIGQQFSSFLTFDWAKKVWNWLDTTFGITEKYNQAKGAIELIKTGKFQNILTGLTTLLGCGIILLVLGALAVATVIIAIIVDVFGNFLFAVLSIALLIVVLILAVLGFVAVVLPNLR